MIPLFWTAVAFGAAWRYHRTGGAGAAGVLAAACALAALYHLQHVFWLPAPFVLLWRRNRRHAAFFAAAVLVAVLAPQVAVYRLTTPAAWVRWYMNMGSASETTWGYRPGVLRLVFPADRLAGTLFRTLWAWPPWERSWPLLALLAGAAACLLGALAAGARGKAGGDKEFALFLGLYVLGTLSFLCLSVWSTEVRYGAGLVLAVVAALALFLRGAPGRRAVPAFLWGLWFCTAGYNLRADVVPQSRWELNRDLQGALLLKSRAAPGATVLIQGGFHKLYLTGLAGLGIVTLDHYLIRYPKDEALGRAVADLRSDLSRGTPVYALSDVREGTMWTGLPPEKTPSAAEMDAFLAAFAAVDKGPLTPGVNLLRLWPRGAPPSYWAYAAERAAADGDAGDAAYARARAGGPSRK
jgi:hypothetical protein